MIANRRPIVSTLPTEPHKHPAGVAAAAARAAVFRAAGNTTTGPLPGSPAWRCSKGDGPPTIQTFADSVLSAGLSHRHGTPKRTQPHSVSANTVSTCGHMFFFSVSRVSFQLFHREG